ncbi:multicopper oxidase [Aspergillus lucknowensis]|uniref:Laccase-1 n=1 Tax=Aspergillus lucknowensis TaxID=176173 RepID=A0ABR4M455_9EURO
MYLPPLLQGLTLCLGLSSARLVRQTLELTWETGAPNGGEPRDMIFTNGQYPGPELVWDEGDDVEVLVFNSLPFNTTVHWHGLEMKETPWADGVPGLSQRPIEPGSSFLYEFKAYPAGTFWYHSHYKGLVQDGQVGSIYIRRKPDAPRPYSAITEDENELAQLIMAENNPNLILVTDWTYLTADDYHQVEVESGFNVFCVDSLLINGRGSVYCPGYEYLEEVGGEGIKAVLEGTHLTEKGCLQPDLYNVQGDYGNWNISAVPPAVVFDCTPSEGEITVITVNPEENGWASLNFIAGTSQKGLTFSVDNHPMWVYEVDGQLVEPRQVEMVAAYNGARYAVMIKLDQTPGEYTIRAADNGGDQVMSEFAILSYANAYTESGDIPQARLGPHSEGYMNYGGGNTSSSTRQLVFTENLPAFDAPHPPPPSAFDIPVVTLRTAMTRVNSSYSWSLGHHALYEPEITSSTPLLFEPDPLATVGERYALSTPSNTWVDIVLEIIANNHDPIHPPHPIHKHGNRAYIIGSGEGPFTWSSVAEASSARPELFEVAAKPALRDTFVMNLFDSRRQTGSWVVIRYYVSGGKFASLLHCHIVSHQVGGMALALLEGVDVWDSGDWSEPYGYV